MVIILLVMDVSKDAGLNGLSVLIQMVCDKNTLNELMAIGLIKTLVGVLEDRPPSVPPRGVPLPSVLTTRPRKPKVEGVHYVRWLRATRRLCFG